MLLLGGRDCNFFRWIHREVSLNVRTGMRFSWQATRGWQVGKQERWQPSWAALVCTRGPSSESKTASTYVVSTEAPELF